MVQVIMQRSHNAYLVIEVTAEGAVIAHHGVGGVIPRPVYLYHILLRLRRIRRRGKLALKYSPSLRPARLLRQSIMILLDPGMDKALGPQGGQSQVGGGGGCISGGAALAAHNNINNLNSLMSLSLSPSSSSPRSSQPGLSPPRWRSQLPSRSLSSGDLD